MCIGNNGENLIDNRYQFKFKLKTDSFHGSKYYRKSQYQTHASTNATKKRYGMQINGISL